MSVKLTPNGTYGVEMPRPPRLMMALMRPLMRFGSAMMRRRGMKVLTLVTTGAKSGRRHEVELGWFADEPDADGRWLILATNAGAAKHPAWYFNLARNPDKTWIELDGHTIKVRPESLEGDARTAAYARISAIMPNYGEYQTKTDRQIPIVRLTAEPG
jgi:deazaflavin-dependent oxidoreductase (nitroreductase family)